MCLRRGGHELGVAAEEGQSVGLAQLVLERLQHLHFHAADLLGGVNVCCHVGEVEYGREVYVFVLGCNEDGRRAHKLEGLLGHGTSSELQVAVESVHGNVERVSSQVEAPVHLGHPVHQDAPVGGVDVGESASLKEVSFNPVRGCSFSFQEAVINLVDVHGAQLWVVEVFGVRAISVRVKHREHGSG